MTLYVWKWAGGQFVKELAIDYGTSVIWRRCYNTAGDFELYVRATPELMELFHSYTTIITRSGHREIMITDKINLTTSIDDGDYLIISGRSGESILGYRVFTKQWNYSNWYAESMIRDMITTQIIAPDDLTRAIPLIRLGENHGWAVKTSKQVVGKNLLTVITDVCESFDWGFELAWDGNSLTFELYEGADRSGGELPHVVFSSQYENLGNTEYSRDHGKYFNSIYVAGEGEGSDRVVVNDKTGKTGLFLREMWVDAKNTSSTTEGGTLSPSEYREMLHGQALEEIELHKDTIYYNGEVFDTSVYTYGKDYFLGDKVTVVNDYGIRGTAIVSEITEVEDSTGYRIYPTLTEWSV